MQRFLSRKFLLAVLAAGIAFGNFMFGWGLTVEEVLVVVGPLLSFVGIEGLADYSERKIKAELEVEGQ